MSWSLQASRGSQRAPALSHEPEAKSWELLSAQAQGSSLPAHGLPLELIVGIAMLIECAELRSAYSNPSLTTTLRR